MNNKRVWLYCRCANDNAWVIEKQKRDLESFADSQGWVVVGHSLDCCNGRSFDRPGLSEVTAAVKDKAFDILLIPYLSRLCRSTEDILAYRKFLAEHEVCLYSAAKHEGNMDVLLNLGQILLNLTPSDFRGACGSANP